MSSRLRSRVSVPATGRAVLFDRDYVSICERAPGVPVRRSDPLPGWTATTFYFDGNVANRTPQYKKRPIAEAKLREWGEDMYASVMAEIDEGIRNSVGFSWRRRTWLYPDAANPTYEAG